MKDLWEKAYKKGNTPWRAKAVSKYVEYAKVPVGMALDLGCGTGEKSEELAALGFEVTGLDFSKEALKATKGLKGKFVEFDLDHIKDYPLEDYILGVCWLVYNFVNNKEDFVQSLHDHCEYLIVTVFTRHPELRVAESDLKLLTSVFTVLHEGRKELSPEKEVVTYILKR